MLRGFTLQCSRQSLLQHRKDNVFWSSSHTGSHLALVWQNTVPVPRHLSAATVGSSSCCSCLPPPALSELPCGSQQRVMGQLCQHCCLGTPQRPKEMEGKSCQRPEAAQDGGEEMKGFSFPSCHGRKGRTGGHFGGVTDRDAEGASPVQ